MLRGAEADRFVKSFWFQSLALINMLELVFHVQCTPSPPSTHEQVNKPKQLEGVALCLILVLILILILPSDNFNRDVVKSNLI